MDLSKLSDADLDALANNDLSKLSDGALQHLASNTPAEAPTGPDTTSMAERFGAGFMDPIHGGAQLASRAAADLTGKDLGSKSVDRGVREREADYRQRRGAEANKFDAWRLAGNVLNPATAAIGLPSALTSKIGRLVQGAGMGGASSAMSPVTEGTPDEFWGKKGEQTALGAGFGAAAVPITGLANRLISPKASTDPQVQELLKAGVRMTPGQMSGPMGSKFEEVLQSLPIAGDLISAMRKRAQGDFRQATVNQATKPINQIVGRDTGQNMVADAYQGFNNAYDKARGALGPGWKQDAQFTQELADLRQLASGLTPELRARFERNIRSHVTNNVSPAGGMTPETYKKVVSDLGELSATNTGGKLMAQQDYGNALKQLQSLVEQQARRNNPQAQAMFDAADRGYGPFKDIQRASASAAQHEGDFTPGQLVTAIKTGDRSKDKGRTAAGEARNQQWANTGMRLGNRVPDSGTAGRLATQVAVGGGLGLADLTTAGAATGLIGTLYSPPMQAALRTTMARRPEVAQDIAEALAKLSPRLGLATAPTGIEAIKD